MARPAVKPADFGIPMELGKFADLMLGELELVYNGQLSIDNLVCRPQSAGEFCQTMRTKHGWIDVPDYAILEPMMNRRKNKRGRERS